MSVCLGDQAAMHIIFLMFRAGTTIIPAPSFMTFEDNKLAVGKYLVSPLAKAQCSGGFAASVSIRSGRGSTTHDRVLRFAGLFDSAASAIQYATEHALCWIQERSPSATGPACAA